MTASLLYGLDLAGVAVFALSGALAAGRKRMDVFGIFVLATATAVGGGTLRDLLLDRGPVFWVEDPLYLGACAAGALAAILAERLWSNLPRLLLVADACGLALFSVLGAQVAASAGVAPAVVVLMGVVTGVAGGVVRDLLCGEVPLVLRREIYATAALLGAGIYVAAAALAAPATLGTLLGAAAALVLRLAALRFGLSLPVFAWAENGEGDTR